MIVTQYVQQFERSQNNSHCHLLTFYPVPGKLSDYITIFNPMTKLEGSTIFSHFINGRTKAYTG